MCWNGVYVHMMVDIPESIVWVFLNTMGLLCVGKGIWDGLGGRWVTAYLYHLGEYASRTRLLASLSSLAARRVANSACTSW